VKLPIEFKVMPHATVQADRLAATDRGYLRRCFPALTLLEHTTALSRSIFGVLLLAARLGLWNRRLDASANSYDFIGFPCALPPGQP
jgi:hypothetical protein